MPVFFSRMSSNDVQSYHVQPSRCLPMSSSTSPENTTAGATPVRSMPGKPTSIQRKILYFGGDETVEVRTEPLPPPDSGEVQVQTSVSAISGGTEKLVYRGDVPEELLEDATITALRQEHGEGDEGGRERMPEDASAPRPDVSSPYPLPYGYACVGRISKVGSAAHRFSEGQRVFAFHPHASHFNASEDAVIPLPDSLPDEDAAFLPNVETAVGLLMDGAPLVGERVAVFGLGVVGLLVTSLLSDYPVDTLVAIDPLPERRRLARNAGATHVTSSTDIQEIRRVLEIGSASVHDPTAQPAAGADLVFELSGQPAALNQALEACGYGGRMILGSWYGSRTADVDLGARFHRSHVSIRSSQVSTIGPEHRARFTKDRRMRVALAMCEQIRPYQAWGTTHGMNEAKKAYQRIADGSTNHPQILLSYPSNR